MGQALELVRGHVSPLSGPLVLLALLATVASICLVKAMAGQRPRSAPAEPKGKKAKEPQTAALAEKSKGKKETSEERAHDSPRKRKK